MRKFKQLTRTKRLQLESYLRINMKVKDIANLLGYHTSTIYREIKRGLYEHTLTDLTNETRYSCDIAQQLAEENAQLKGSQIKLGNDYEFATYIENKIMHDKYSPVAVLGEIKRKNIQFKTTICHRTLYSYIEKGVFENLSIEHLPMKIRRKKNKRKVVIKRRPRGTSIEDRPKEIKERKTFGHWEMDCVCGPTKPTLLVLTERLTRQEIIMKMPNQKSESVIKCLNIIEHNYGKNFKKIFKSITVDNGSEFSDFDGLEKSKFGKNSKRTSVYYCHPYSSYERGTNERINREIRRIIPKGSDLSKYSDEDIKQVENWINNYPRKVLDYYSSNDLYKIHLNLLI